MPPPTSSDTWLAGRRFGVVIDAGSSGSRLQVYSWKDPRAARDAGLALDILPKVEKGTRDSEAWSLKVEPGISSFADNPEGVAGYLAPLLAHARDIIPPSLESETPLFLLATAGMRLLTPTQQKEVLNATCRFLKYHSNLRINESSPEGPCGSSIRIITGEEEGLFGWIAVNYLMDGFSGSNDRPPTYGFLDMGGASTQIAFEPSKADQEKVQGLADVRLRLLNGQEILHKVFVTTWLGYGTNQARERYIGRTLGQHESISADTVVEDPCLPKHLRLTESPDSLSSIVLEGSGSFEQCLERTLPLLNKDVPCPDADDHCLFNGVYVPPIDFSASNFIGVSEYWYSSEHVFGLGGAYDVVQYERAASEFCSREWGDIIGQHEQLQQHTRLSGAGEMPSDGQYAGAGIWGDTVNIPRLQMQCFKAAWIVNVLHEGIGLPRIIDAGGNTTTSAEEVDKEAQRKGLGRPTFQSLDTVGDIAISWTLGKMVLEASKDVPALPSSSSSPNPLSEPSIAVPPPMKYYGFPFLDFDAIEDRISPHLPSALTRESLGFSPVAFFFYCVAVVLSLTVVYRLRHRCRRTMRRRAWSKKDRDYLSERYHMEEGEALTVSPSMSRQPSLTSISSQIFQPLRTISSALGSRTRPPPIVINSPHSPRSGLYSPARVSPLRSFSYPPAKPGGSPRSPLDTPNVSVTAYVPGSPRLQDGSMLSNGSLSSLTSRSRNSSQINLSASLSRQTISRTASLHSPVRSVFTEE